MQVGLNRAARLTGKDASTITRACHTGRLSFTKDENGSRIFEIAELERVYGPLRQRAHAVEVAAEVAGLQREIDRLLTDQRSQGMTFRRRLKVMFGGRAANMMRQALIGLLILTGCTTGESASKLREG